MQNVKVFQFSEVTGQLCKEKKIQKIKLHVLAQINDYY